MEVEADPNLLVVNFEPCMSSETRYLEKSSCIYTTMSASSFGHDVLQLAGPVQSLSDLNQTISSIHHQHLTQLPQISYPQVQVSYDDGNLQQPNSSLLVGGNPIYQSSSATVHQCLPSNSSPAVSPRPHSYSGYLTSTLPIAPHPSISDCSPIIPLLDTHALQTKVPTQPDDKFLSLDISSLADTTMKTLKKEVSESPPTDDYQYYLQIENLLQTDEGPPNSSPIYIKKLRKRAQNYLLVDGTLHHNPKHPRKVIMRKEDQNKLIESFHVNGNTGVHNGIKKMSAKLREEYFWRGMYLDVATYVRNCTKCSETMCNVRSPPVIINNLSDELSVQENISIGTQTTSKIWNDIEVQICGPFNKTNNRNAYIATVVDPKSNFLSASALPSSGLATKLTQFILTSFYSFGFTNAHLVISNTKLCSAVQDEFYYRTKDLPNCDGLLKKRNTPYCKWVTSLLTQLVDQTPSRWDRELDEYLFRFRSGEINKFGSSFTENEDDVGTISPFFNMFHRSPYPKLVFLSSENKENSFPSKSEKKKIMSAHKNKELSATTKCFSSSSPNLKNSSTQKQVRKKKSINEVINNLGRNIPSKISKETEPIKMAVNSVKTFLAETRVVRQRRGNYNKYPDELKEKMACYALKHGSQDAAKHFSNMLGTQVHDSTIRNLVKARKRFGLSLKKEIATYATENGVAEAAKHFSSSLNITVSHYLIRRFKSLYGSKNLLRNKIKKDLENLTEKVKNDIGIYAIKHTEEETINHFKNLLGFNLTESTIKQLKQDLLKKDGQENIVNEQVNFVNNSNICEEVYQQSCSTSSQDGVDGSDSSNGCVVPMISDHFLLVAPEDQANYNLGVQIKIDEAPSWKSGDNSCQKYPTADNHMIVNENRGSESPTLLQQTEDNSNKKLLDKKNQINKINKTINKRGSYAKFSPELRAQIGKYAVENGCLKASQYFSKILGRDLPESTARSIKVKYLKKLKFSEVTSLGYSPRGRAPLLGKYDELVQNCLIELIKSGERGTSFLAIITAKNIITQYEPTLLKENGGNIDLNTSWAKSFLKRLGLRNNS